MNIEAWLPTLVSALMLGLIVYFIKSNKSDNIKAIAGVEKDMVDIKDRIEKDEDAYMTEKNHKVTCENAQLRLREHVSTVVKEETKLLGDAIFGAIRDLTKEIRKE